MPFYRYLYNTVGGDYLWWLRRTTPDDELAALLADPLVGIHVLYRNGEPAGFFELDGRTWPDTNLSYFGLMPHAVGTGLGFAFLRQAVDTVWRQGARGMTVNTCTADHPAGPAQLPARRVPHRAPGAGDLERAGAAGPAHSGAPEDLGGRCHRRPRG